MVAPLLLNRNNEGETMQSKHTADTYSSPKGHEEVGGNHYKIQRMSAASLPTSKAEDDYYDYQEFTEEDIHG